MFWLPNDGCLTQPKQVVFLDHNNKVLCRLIVTVIYLYWRNWDDRYYNCSYHGYQSYQHLMVAAVTNITFNFLLAMIILVTKVTNILVLRFVIPVVFIIKLDWSVFTCLTQLHDGRYMYRIYYIKNSYMFRHFTLAIFRLRNEKT